MIKKTSLPELELRILLLAQQWRKWWWEICRSWRPSWPPGCLASCHHAPSWHLVSVLLQDEEKDGDVEVMVSCCVASINCRIVSLSSSKSLPHYSLRDLVGCDGCLEKADQTIPPVEVRVGSKCHVDHGRALLARLTKDIVDSDGTEFEVNRHISLWITGKNLN